MNALMAAVAAVCGAFAAVEVLALVARPRSLAAIGVLLGPASSAGARGRDAGTADRLRLALLSSAGACVLAWSLLGPAAAAVAGALATAVPGVFLRLRRRRWRGAMRSGAGAAARAIGDGAGAGLPAIAAIERAAVDGAVPAAVAIELTDLATRARLGQDLGEGLEELRARAACAQWDALTAAIGLQREVGGDLSLILNGLAQGLDEGARARREASSLSSQARLTARIVIGLPLAGVAISEIASPGTVAAMLSGPVSRLLVGLALILQAVAAVVVRRIARLGGLPG